MKKLLGFFIILTIIAINKTSAAPCDLPQHMNAGATIGAECVFRDKSVSVDGTLTLINHGTIDAGFHISGPHHFIIRNTGAFKATVSRAGGAEVFQHIASPSELTRLDIDVPFTPVITEDFAGRLGASKLIDVFGGNTVRVQGAGLTIDAARAELSPLAGILSFENPAAKLYLYITDYDGSDYSYLNFGAKVFYLFGKSDDPMFVYWADGGKTRQTVYSVIFPGDPRAKFLDDLRDRDPDNRVLANLDNAQSREALLSEMGRTMFFNPMVLNDSVLAKMTRIEFADEMDSGQYAGLKTDPFGAYKNVGFDLWHVGRDFMLRLDFNAGRLVEDDDYKYGAAMAYGVGVAAHAGALGFGARAAFADWDGVLIQDGVAAVTSAQSRLFYVFSEFAPRIGPAQPVVRFNYAESEILGRKRGDFFISGGARVAFSEEMMGMKNTYGAFATYVRGEPDYGVFFDVRFMEDGAALGVKISRANLSVETRLAF